MLIRAAIILLSMAVLTTGQPVTADLILVNGNIRTLDRAKPRAEAMAISGGLIVAVGTNRELQAFIGPRTQVIDAGGRLVLPGFNDAHVHFAAIGNSFSSMDLRKPRTRAELGSLFSKYTAVLPHGRWILGSGWAVSAREDIGLSRRLVDPLTPANPVFIYSSDASVAFANAGALRLAGIGSEIRDPTDGMIERDATGEPTGVLSGSAVRMVRAVVPQDHIRNWPEILETASNYAASLGVTSVQDMHSDELADVYRQLQKERKLKTRVYDCSPLSARSKLSAGGIKAASGDAMVRTGCVKTFASDYSDYSAYSDEDLGREIGEADRAGLQVMVHAIGAVPNRRILSIFEKTIAANGKRDRRFRIEHAQELSDEDAPRVVRSGVIASMQPWLFYAGTPGWTSYKHKRNLGSGMRIAFGSDASITDFDPLAGIYAATSANGGISIEEAVRAYTAGSAYAEFQEKVKGRIERGMLADFVILDRDFFVSKPEQIRDAKVVATFVDGKQVYGSRL